MTPATYDRASWEALSYVVHLVTSTNPRVAR